MKLLYPDFFYKVFIVLLTALFFNVSCEDPFQYNPNEVTLADSEKGLNQKNISKIEELNDQDTLSFILIADIHHEYEDLEDFVQLVNTMNGIRFIVIAGDLTNFGLQAEYRQTNDILKKLFVPYIAVVGNHDILGNGEKVFKEMFGSFDFSFSSNRHKFICINNNSREYGFDGTVPDLTWLSNELRDTASFDNYFVIGHVPPYTGDFDPELEDDYKTLLASTGYVKISMHGHHGGFSSQEHYGDGVVYVTTDDMKDRAYVLIKVWDNSFSVESKTF